ncbi:MAG: hypothetical protein RSC93_02580 [Erysipelotrichaceae bacterium]
MRDYRVDENVLDTMEKIANNHKINMTIKKNYRRTLIGKDDEGNTWIGLPAILDFFNEFIVNTDLCILEQIEQIHKYWNEVEGTKDFPLQWLETNFLDNIN